MKTLDRDFLQLIGNRIINRANRLGIELSDIGITPAKEKSLINGEYQFTFTEIKEIAEKLYIDPLRLLSKDYKDFTIRFRNIDRVHFQTIQHIEEILHVLISESLIKETLFKDLTKEYVNLKRDYGLDNFTIGITIANKTRNIYGIGISPINLFKFCFENNFYPLIINENSAFEGALLVIDNYAVALIKSTYVPRMHFTLAHELGHFIMHKNLEIRFDDKINLNDTKPEEVTANYFASEMILPSEAVRQYRFIDLQDYCISKEALSISLERNKVNLNLDFYVPKCDIRYVKPYTLNNIIRENIDLYGIELKRIIELLLWNPRKNI
ncbi:ImmA/IrrE family metallo-endopeptidase [Persephonella atlantica]|uniref:ImmA/IrrE family metallo-endopeptidase n=1 Tax=Persephonella atlantica TaxID=2699429 RepID=A0ABS1GI77_9AQUI|nr:ImmA/IrrE family metallo-endopeptidase [Persephonella atlantica]MBK3332541.1 ImmA/IrrE family metallo-endopeptidase [Persephonella atlantica]